LLSLVGPPDRKFAKQARLNIVFQTLLGFVGRKINILAKKLGVTYTFVFVKPSGAHLGEITKLIETVQIKPVIDNVFSMNDAKNALTYVEQGRTKGKVVIDMRQSP
jgi:NADPH:quinone reductase-like Zn-dependent oxidoreductase